MNDVLKPPVQGFRFARRLFNIQRVGKLPDEICLVLYHETNYARSLSCVSKKHCEMYPYRYKQSKVIYSLKYSDKFPSMPELFDIINKL